MENKSYMDGTYLEPADYEKDLDEFHDNVLKLMYSTVKIVTTLATDEFTIPDEDVEYFTRVKDMVFGELWKPAMRMSRKPFSATIKFKIKFIEGGGPIVEDVEEFNLSSYIEVVKSAIAKIENFLERYISSKEYDNEEALNLYSLSSPLVREFNPKKVESIAVSIMRLDNHDESRDEILELLTRMDFLVYSLGSVIEENGGFSKGKPGKIVPFSPKMEK